MTFQLYCQSLGIQLLRDDIKFIRAQLKRYHHSYHKNILSQYASIWVQSMAECHDDAKKMNHGRREANLFLLGYGDGTSRNG